MIEPVVGEPQLYLASASPRRAELLRQLGIRFAVVVATVEERRAASESPEAYVRRVALAKAEAGFAQTTQQPPLPVLGADTEVVLDDEVFGKPRDATHGGEMLRRLSGRTHRVLSAVAVVRGGTRHVIVQESLVQLRDITAAECAAYWATGEPADKAGGYAIQGRGAIFIRHLQGSYSGVMGLPLFETAGLLQSIGMEVLTGEASA